MSDVGFALVYLGWGVGVGALAFTATRGCAALWRLRPIAPGRLLIPSPPSATASLAPLLVLGLMLPCVEGTAAEGAPVVLSGFTGLDPASVGLIVAGALATAFLALVAAATAAYGRGADDADAATARSLRFAMAVLAACVAAVLLGNALILAAWPDGSRATAGVWGLSALAAVVAAVASLEWRRSPARLRRLVERPGEAKYRPRYF